MIVLSGGYSKDLAMKVAHNLNVRYVQIEFKQFPDGENYIRIPCDVKDMNCVLVHTTKTNNDLIELFLALSALRESEAKSVICVVPYLMYMRQDKAFLDGEAVSARAILGIISQSSDKIITVNVHFSDTEGKQGYKGITFYNVDAFPLLARHFKDIDIVIAPDEGSLKKAKQAAALIHCDFDHIEKKRISGDAVMMKPKKFSVSGKSVLLLDDIISTGGTIKGAAKMLKDQGARNVSVGCVHGVFAVGTKIFSSIVDDLVCTDTIPTEISKVSVAALLTKAIRGL